MSHRLKNAEYLGSLDVDAGIIMMGDPCYILPDDASHRDEAARDLGVLHERTDFVTGVSKPWGEGVAIQVGTCWGDGSYPVYAERDERGRIRRVLIDFDPNEEE